MPILATTYQLTNDLPRITLVANKGKLIALDWFTHKTEKILNQLTEPSKFIARKELYKAKDDNARVLLDTLRQLEQYVNGQLQAFDVPLDISTGTPFQKKVWEALLKIPYGQTISYAQLANLIGQPTAYRAVANANGKNPISLIIPCHRVIASNGELGGYTGGVAIKQQLLALEQVT